MKTLQERMAEVFPPPLPRGVKSRIAKLCSVKSSSVNAWFYQPQKVSSISRTNAEILCAAFDLKVSPAWLAEGIPPKLLSTNQPVPLHPRVNPTPVFKGTSHTDATNVAAAPALRHAKGVPVVGEVKAGPDGYLEELQYPVGHGEGIVEYWTSDQSAYALRVRGDSMHPRYRAGEYVVVTPSIEATPGSDVVVACQDGCKLLKQLNWQRDGEIQLLSINGDYAPMTLQLSEILSIHRVAGSVGRDSFQKS